jgi:hypothetical protein
MPPPLGGPAGGIPPLPASLKAKKTSAGESAGAASRAAPNVTVDDDEDLMTRAPGGGGGGGFSLGAQSPALSAQSPGGGGMALRDVLDVLAQGSLPEELQAEREADLDLPGARSQFT